MTQNVKPPFYWERQIAKAGRRLASTRPVNTRNPVHPLRRVGRAALGAVSARIIDLEGSDYCEI